MDKPVLVVMAAGMGSRYGGLKQIDPVGPGGEVIMDYSLYDAKRAGFEKTVFVIKKENEAAFRAAVTDPLKRRMETEVVFQRLDDLPAGYAVPAGRQKPWGTAHALLSCRHVVKGPFVAINADDYYGPDAFVQIYDYLTTHKDDDVYEYCMVGYQLKNTVTENGHVARGVCELDDKGFLKKVTERTKIMHHEDGIAYTEDDGESWTQLPEDTIVSMNFWGFSKSMMEELQSGLPAFLKQALAENPLKGEYFLPGVADRLVQEGKARVKVLTSHDKWYGVTYKEDKEDVRNALQAMKDKGEHYPEKLWK